MNNGSGGSFPCHIVMYNPDFWKCSAIRIRNSQHDSSYYVITSGSVSYSQDYITWEEEATFTNDNQVDGAYWDILISSPVYAKYRRVTVNSATSSTFIIADINFVNATYLAEGSPDYINCIAAKYPNITCIKY